MAGLALSAPAISLDEWCFGITEINLQSPGYKGFHRYQIVNVIRADKLVEHRIDLGLAKNFTAQQFKIPGGVIDEATGRMEILHTVGELMDIAIAMRNGVIGKPPDFEPSDLIGRYMNQLEEQERQRRKASTIGALARIQRG